MIGFFRQKLPKNGHGVPIDCFNYVWYANRRGPITHRIFLHGHWSALFWVTNLANWHLLPKSELGKAGNTLTYVHAICSTYRMYRRTLTFNTTSISWENVDFGYVIMWPPCFQSEKQIYNNFTCSSSMRNRSSGWKEFDEFPDLGPLHSKVIPVWKSLWFLLY